MKKPILTCSATPIQRAQAVADLLAEGGVQRARMAAQGYGESQPKASNTTEEGRSANRRVEIRLVPITQGQIVLPLRLIKIRPYFQRSFIFSTFR